jgi:hypothetical protein
MEREADEIYVCSSLDRISSSDAVSPARTGI